MRAGHFTVVDLAQLRGALVVRHIDRGIDGCFAIVCNHILAVRQMHIDVNAVALLIRIMNGHVDLSHLVAVFFEPTELLLHVAPNAIADVVMDTGYLYVDHGETLPFRAGCPRAGRALVLVEAGAAYAFDCNQLRH